MFSESAYIFQYISNFLQTGTNESELIAFRQDDSFASLSHAVKLLLDIPDNNASENTAVFLAQCVRQKCMYFKGQGIENGQFETSCTHILTNIISIVAKFQKRNRVLIQLSLSFVAFAFRSYSLLISTSIQENDKVTMFEQILQLVHSLGISTQVCIWKNFPEIYNVKRLLTPDDRIFLNPYMKQHQSKIVLKTVVYLLQQQQQPGTDTILCFDCLTQWLDVNWIDSSVLLDETNLFGLLLESLRVKNAEFVGAIGPIACDISWSLVQETYKQLEFNRDIALSHITSIVTQVFTLKEDLANPIQSLDAFRRSMYIVLILSNIAKGYISLIVNQIRTNPNNILNDILLILLECSSHPNFRIACLVFDVWIFIWGELHKTNTKCVVPHRVATSINAPLLKNNDKKKQEIKSNTYLTEDIQCINPYFDKLCIILISKSCYPNDFISFDLEDRDGFRIMYRNDIRDTLRNVSSPESRNSVLVHAFDIITDEIRKSEPDWRTLEGAVHVLTAIYTKLENKNPIKQILKIASTFPSHPELLCTLCILIRLANDLIQKDETVMESIFNILELALSCQEGDEVWDMRDGEDHVAVVAWLKLTFYINSPFSNYIASHHFEIVSRKALSMFPPAKNSTLLLSSRLLFLSAFGNILNASSLSVQHLNDILDILFASFVSQCDAKNPNLLETIHCWANIIGNISSEISPNGSSILMIKLQNIWKTIETMFSWAMDPRVTNDSLLKALCSIMVKLFSKEHQFENAFPIINAVIHQMIFVFENTYHTESMFALYTASKWLAKGHTQNISSSARESIENALLYVLSKVSDVFHTITDDRKQDGKHMSVDQCFEISYQWFSWCVMIGENMPQMFIAHPTILQQFINDIISTGLQLHDRRTGERVLHTIQQIGKWYISPVHNEITARFHQCIDQIMRSIHPNKNISVGSCLLLCLLLAAYGSMPHFMLKSIINTIWDLCEAFGADVFDSWLRDALQQNLHGSSDKKKEIFYQQFMSFIRTKNKQKVKRVLKSFCGGKKKQ